MNHFETSGLEVEKLTSSELTEQKIREVANLFRKIFCNTYGQYLVFPSDGKPLSPQEHFGTEGFIPLERLDQVDSFPTKPETQEQAVFWHDPETTFQRFHEKFRHHAHLVLIRGEELSGMTFGYECTLEEAFRSEEWENPHHYSTFKNPDHLRNFKTFVTTLHKTASINRSLLGDIAPEEINAKTMVYVWNCVVLDPELQGHGYGPALIRLFFHWLMKEKQADALQLGEVIPESHFHKFLKKAGAIDVPGALSDTEILLEIASLKKLAGAFIKAKQ